MAQAKDTELSTEKQPVNGLWGRIPQSLLSQIRELSHLEARVFLVLTTLANFKRKPVGLVPLGVRRLAKECNTSPGSIRRALKGLCGAGMISVEVGSPRSHSGITVIHYRDLHDPTVGSPCSHSPPQPQQNITTYEPPIRSEDVSEKEVKRKEASAPPKLSKKNPKSASKKARASTTAHLIQWDTKEAKFTGDIDRLREKVYQHYDDLGKVWIDATWTSITEYCDLHPEFVERTKDFYLAILGWFRKDAKEKRSRTW